MIQQIIKIPSGIQYLSEFKMEDGSKYQLPNGILNKELKIGCTKHWRLCTADFA